MRGALSAWVKCVMESERFVADFAVECGICIQICIATYYFHEILVSAPFSDKKVAQGQITVQHTHLRQVVHSCSCVHCPDECVMTGLSTTTCPK